MPKPAFLMVAPLVATILAVAAAPANAQLAPVDPPSGAVTDSIAVSFALSGGVSNGSYQAGVLSAVLAYMRASNAGELDAHLRTRRFAISGVTGASAGSINGLAVPLTWCSPSVAPVTESLLWRMWVPVGLSQLLASDADGDSAVFSRRFFVERQLPLVRTALATSECPSPILIGFTLTRREPLLHRIGDPGISIPVQRMVTAFELDREGLRQSARLDSSSRAGAVIRLTGDAEDAAIDAILASSAFPVAFHPVPLVYTRQGADSTRAVFLDGGVFENNPLPLLRALLPAADGAPGPERWTTAVAAGFRPPSDSVPTVRQDAATQLASSLALVGTGRSYELSLLLRSESDVEWLRTLRPAIRYAPTFGATMMSFGAFLSRSFREYDFLAGVADGLRYAATHWTCDPGARAGRGACLTEADEIDAMASQLAGLVREVASDSVARRVVLVVLDSAASIAPSRDSSSVRERALLLIARQAYVLDSVPEANRLRSSAAECRVNELGPACSSGVWHLMSRLERSLGRPIRRTAATCVWDARSLAWAQPRPGEKPCYDDGFMESTDWGLWRPHLDFPTFMAKPTEGVDHLMEEVARRAYDAGLSDLGLGARAGWWALRSVVPPTQAAVWNETHALGVGALRRVVTPYRLGLLTPVEGSAAATTMRLAYMLEGGQRKVLGVQLQGGLEYVDPLQRVDGDPRAAAFGALGTRIMLGGITFEFGTILTKSTGIKRFLGRSSPSFANVTVLDAFVVGAELGDAIPGDPTSKGWRMSVGLNDLSGVFWLLTGW